MMTVGGCVLGTCVRSFKMNPQMKSVMCQDERM